MPLLGLLAAATVTATVTVETSEGVRPVSHAVVYADAPAAPASKRPRREPPLELRCGARGVEPPVAVLAGTRRVVVINDRAALTQVQVQAQSGLVLLNATLVSRGQATPQVRLRSGRATVVCRVAGSVSVGHVLALAHPHFGVSDEQGAVRFDAEPGSRWRIWHPALGRVEYALTSSSAFPRPTF